MIETNSQFMNRVEQRREQRQREMEAWVRQTTFADLRHPSPWNEYPKLLEQVQSGQTRAAIYALVGTKRQVNGNGLVRQVEKCLAECVLRGFAVTEEDIYLEVGSGSDASRPVLKRLLSQCESKQYQVIVIEVADRWWQGFPGDAEPLYECLEAAGTRLVTYHGDPTRVSHNHPLQVGRGPSSERQSSYRAFAPLCGILRAAS